ncbi:MAG: hypothetical protein AB7N76_03460 [Planctomycetota bacterium]
MRARILVVLLALAASALPAAAQQAAPPGASGMPPGLAERYQVAAWPQPSAARAGWDTGSLAVPGWERVSLRLDPRAVEATLGLRPAAKQQPQETHPGQQAKAPQPKDAQSKDAQSKEAQPTVLVRVRSCASPAAARRWLLAHLGACQTTLRREPGLGDVAFGARGGERLLYVAAAQGNLAWTVRALRPDVDAGPVAAAVDAHTRRAPVGAAKAPRLEGAEPAPAAQPGQPLPFSLSFAGDAPAALDFDAGPHASVVPAQGRYLLYADRAGEVEVKVTFMTADLRAAKAVIVLHAR